MANDYFAMKFSSRSSAFLMKEKMIAVAKLLCLYYTDVALLINRSWWEGPCSFFLPFWHPRVMMYSWTLMIECWLPLPGHTRHFHTYLFSTASSCLAPALAWSFYCTLTMQNRSREYREGGSPKLFTCSRLSQLSTIHHPVNQKPYNYPLLWVLTLLLCIVGL